MNKWIITLGLSVAVAGCTREAGYEIDQGAFGNATLNNIQVMNGELTYGQILAQRFAAEVPSQINFAFDSAQLDASAQRILLQQANWIKQFPEARFRVYGHTDAVGSQSYNYNLGLRRANAVVNFLVQQGISRSRLEALVSFGKTRPLVATTDRDRRNRRTVTEVSGLVERHPNILDGKYAQVIYREYVQSATFATQLSRETAVGSTSEQ
ncbi:OmpA family protein [Ruegeria lacuscaerulensis ITI-1157]|nr:OmpA family protein [Ruegeria lacuscaerulensis ITI-1157]SHI41792.1 Outer membrane protein OmpA [Ruegeria lacuscaerulensis ITI-1157]